MYKYKGTIDLGEGLIITDPDFEIVELRYLPKENLINASISFVLNAEKDYRAVREYGQELPEGVQLFDPALLEQLVMGFDVDGTVEN